MLYGCSSTLHSNKEFLRMKRNYSRKSQREIGHPVGRVKKCATQNMFSGKGTHAFSAEWWYIICQIRC